MATLDEQRYSTEYTGERARPAGMVIRPPLGLFRWLTLSVMFACAH